MWPLEQTHTHDDYLSPAPIGRGLNIILYHEISLKYFLSELHEEDALSTFLMECGLEDTKWLTLFHEYHCKNPDELVSIKGNKKIFLALSKEANAEEHVALKKLLNPPENPGVEEELKKRGLDSAYWSTILMQQLGAISAKAWDYIEPENCRDLVRFARKHEEKKIIKCLRVEDETLYMKQRENQKERLNKKLPMYKQILNDLQRFQVKDRDRFDKEVSIAENDIREMLQLAPTAWLHESLTLECVVTNLHNYYERVVKTLKATELCDASLLQFSSQGLMLKGILMTRDCREQIQSRGVLLKVPTDVELRRPIHSQYELTRVFVKKQEEECFLMGISSLGYSIVTCDSAYTSSCTCGSKVQQSRQKKIAIGGKESYLSTVKCSFYPVASCELSDGQLHLSDDAIMHLKEIEKLNASNDNHLVRTECVKFIQKFGSHVNNGTLHFGGVSIRKVFTNGYSKTNEAAVCELQRELGSLKLIGECKAVSALNLQDTRGRYTDELLKKTFVELHHYGSACEVSGVLDWKNSLLCCNNEWVVVDRGVKFLPMWDILIVNHSDTFKMPATLGVLMKQAWKAMTQYYPELTIRDNDEHTSKLKTMMQGWRDTNDSLQCKDYLVSLLETKKAVSEFYMDLEAWSRFYLSQQPLQKFIKGVVDMHIVPHSSDPNLQKKLREHLQDLLEPIDLRSVFFPSKTHICQSLYNTQRSTIPMTCAHFLNLRKYFKHAYNSMFNGMITSDENLVKVVLEPSRSINATSAISRVISCLRSYLNRAGQLYEGLFIDTMLLPCNYNPERCTFSGMLCACDLKYLSTEFEEHVNKFFEVFERDCTLKSQAYLFLLAAQMYNDYDFDVTNSQMKLHIKYVEKRLRDSNGLDVKISKLLSDLKSNKYDWEWFQRDLEFLTHDDSTLKTNDIQVLFSRLGLNEFYPQGLTLRQALEIREDTLANEIVPTQTSDRRSKVDPKLYAFLILQKIMSFDYNCRVKLRHSGGITSTVDSENSSEESEDDSDHNFAAHPMDGLLALLHCADNFLRQELLSRLSTCQLAIPLLLPDHLSNKLTFTLWSMRSIVKEWKTDKSHEGQLVSYRAPLISFMRFGDHTLSKSHIMNSVICDSGHKSFFHFNCDGGNINRLLVNGLVEVCWYLPCSTNSLFPQVITFANVRGDAQDLQKQRDFLRTISFMNFVFINEEDLTDVAIEILCDLSKAPGGLVLLCAKTRNDGKKISNENVKPLKEAIPKEFLSIIKLDANEADTTEKIRNKIKNKLKEKWNCDTLKSLEECRDIANKLSIVVDENDADCKKGKDMANYIKQIIDEFFDTKPNASPKEMLPLQGTELWHEWAKTEKEQYRHVRRGGEGIEDYGGKQRDHMRAIRNEQLHCTDYMHPLMESFLTSLLTHQGDIRNYFMRWLSCFLDNISKNKLPPLHTQYKDMRRKLLEIQSEKKKDTSAEESCKEKLSDLNMKIIHASFGLEHLLREISQLYEAIAPLTCNIPQEKQAWKLYLPGAAAELLIEGYPLELMDGDAAHVPIKWVSAVLEKVREILDNPRLLVLSILGLQSTGKSTLINAVFGLRFNVSAGRCTRGAFMQLVPVHNSLKAGCNCDYYLIVDTEGLRAPELDTLQTQKHDNELATFVIGLGNITVINIYGETPGDLDDILQTAVHAFLRMKVVNLNPSCHFVHQNVPAVLAGEKGMMGRFKFKERLDKMTQAAAEQEKLQNSYRTFKDVIDFNDSCDVSYFPSLWKGDPPMAPVNPGYSQNAQYLKNHLIEFIKPEQKCHIVPLQIFENALKDLWCAILHENFIFSFKNTLEVAAYNTLDQNYSQWSWTFKERMMAWDQKAQNTLKSCGINKLSEVHQELLHELPTHVKKIYGHLWEKMEEYFKQSKKKDIIIKWKKETEARLNELQRHLQTHSENRCNELANYRQGLEKVDSMKEKYRGEIVERVKVLVSGLKDEKLKLSDEDLEQKFNEQWAKWITELNRPDAVKVKVKVALEVENSLLDHDATQKDRILRKLNVANEGKALEDWGIPLSLRVDTEKHLDIKKGWISRVTSFVMGSKGSPASEFMPLAQQRTKFILAKVKDYLDGKQNQQFNLSFTTEILRMVSKEIKEDVHEGFSFTQDYMVDMDITACGYAIKRFRKMDQDFEKENDPVEYLEKEMRAPLLILFKDQYMHIAEEIIAARALCYLLLKPVRQQVILSLSPKIVEDLRGSCPFLHSKPTLKAKVMLDIGEKLHQGSEFEECALYLQHPSCSLKNWILHYTIEHCRKGTPKSRLVELAIPEVTTLVKRIEKTANDVTKDLRTHTEQFDIKVWLTNCHSQLMGKLELNVKELHDLGGIHQLRNVSNFTEEVVRGLNNLESKLHKEFNTIDAKDIHEWPIKPYDIIFETVAGCIHTCPFCSEQCDLTNANHAPASDKCEEGGDITKHSVTMHRPQCLGGYREISSGQMVLDICTSKVGSDRKFKNHDTGDNYHPYKEYYKIYPAWSIPDDKSLNTSQFWKWLVGHYSNKIAEIYAMKERKIPEEWKALEWDKVKEELKKQYKL